MALQTANQYGLGIDGVGLSNRLLKIMQANKVDAATAQTAKAEALQQQLKTTGAQLLHIRNNIEGKEAQKKAIANLATEKINQGQDSGIYDELLNIDDPDLLNTRMTQIIIRATDADKQLEKGLGISSTKSQFGGQVVYKDGQGNLFYGTTVRDPTGANVTSNLVSADPNQPDLKPDGKLELVSRLGETADERVENRVSAAQQVEEIKTEETIKRKEGEKEVALEWNARIAEKVDEAKARAKEKGEVLNEIEQMEASLPLLQESIAELRELSEVATYTTGGRVFDTLVKETGFGATEGATARAKFIAIVNNQVLPLLKPTFGAAFTVQEGESLKSTMGDPNASPEEKQAQLEAFIAQKERNIRAKRQQLTPGAAEVDFSTMTDEQLKAIINE